MKNYQILFYNNSLKNVLQGKNGQNRKYSTGSTHSLNVFRSQISIKSFDSISNIEGQFQGCAVSQR